MEHFGIVKAFAHYGASLRNRMWSVSAWNAKGELVVSQWLHHSIAGPGSSLDFTGSTERWGGHGQREFRRNIHEAFETKAPLRLVLVRTKEIERVESGADASALKKQFSVRSDLVGEVVNIVDHHYRLRFRPSETSDAA